MATGGEVWLSCILLLGAAVFGWNFWQGMRRGVTDIPIQFLGDDVFERGTTMFGLAQAFNVLGCLGTLGLVSKLWIGW
jgi:hypothetical protein